MELEQSYEPEEPQDEDLEAVLSTVAAEGEGAILVQISKIDKGRAAWIFNAHPVDMPNLMERIRDEYGTGDYEAVIRRGNRIARRKRFSLLVPVPKKEEPRQNNEMTVVLQGMQALAAGLADLGKLIVETRQQAIQPVSQFEMMQQNLAMMLQMKQLFDSGSVKVDPTEQFLKGIEFAKEIAGETLGEKSDPTPGQVLANLADKLAPVLVNLTTPKPATPQPMRVTPQASQPPKTVTAPKPAPVGQPIPQPVPQPKQGDPNMLMKMALKNPVARLVQLASGGAIAKDCAIPVLEQVPDSYIDMFADFLEKPDVIQQLISIDPAVNNHIPWFNELVTEMRDQLTFIDDDPTISGSETGIEAIGDEHNTTNDEHTIG